jgi:hypothetical protein
VDNKYATRISFSRQKWQSSISRKFRRLFRFQNAFEAIQIIRDTFWKLFWPFPRVKFFKIRLQGIKLWSEVERKCLLKPYLALSNWQTKNKNKSLKIKVKHAKKFKVTLYRSTPLCHVLFEWPLWEGMNIIHCSIAIW